MKKTEAKVYKQILLALRARLRGDVSHLTETALKKGHVDNGSDLTRMPIHMADIGSENFDQEFSLSLLENDELTLDAIEHALLRIDEGVYGECEECGCKIPKIRLDAIPYSTVCVKCAEKMEKGY
jgi:RNA polymerase-binding transcription factor DksA